MAPEVDPYDPATYRNGLGPGGTACRGGEGPKAPRRRRGELYFGPVPMRWLERACARGGAAWLAASALWFESVTAKGAATVTLPAKTRRRFGLDSPSTLQRALQALQVAGLVHVEGRPGALSRITILDVPRGETP
jgi:hypothetical protein